MIYLEIDAFKKNDMIYKLYRLSRINKFEIDIFFVTSLN